MASEHGDGSTIAVIGSKGAPGASECACSLAVLATRRWPTVLVELDGLGGGLDVRLGGDPRQGSLVGLLNATETSNGLLRELIERWLIHREDWPAVLLAPPDPNAISELATPGSVARAMQTLAGSYPVTVCDVGFLISEAELPAVRVHREALVSADAVVLVIGAREVQVSEGLRQLELLQDTLGIQAERLPGTATKNQITQTLTGCLAERGVTVDAWLAWDARALKRAQRRGTPLACARQRGGYARALTGLLDELFLPAAAGTGSPTPRRQKRRLALPTTAHREADRREEEVVLPWQQS
jgi:hypothetical protein